MPQERRCTTSVAQESPSLHVNFLGLGVYHDGPVPSCIDLEAVLSGARVVQMIGHRSQHGVHAEHLVMAERKEQRVQHGSRAQKAWPIPKVNYFSTPEKQQNFVRLSARPAPHLWIDGEEEEGLIREHADGAVSPTADA